MKHLLIPILAITLISCKRNSTEIVSDYFNSINSKDTSKLSLILGEKFKTTFDNTPLNKISFKRFISEGFEYDQIFEIIKTTDRDSLIEVKVKYKQPLDSLFLIKALPEVDYKFFIKDSKIYQIDSKSDQLTLEQHKKEFNRKYFGVLYYLMDNNLLDDNVTKKNVDDYIKKYYSKFTSENKETQEKYFNTAFLRGTYECKKCIYGNIEFKGLSTCMVLGFYGTSYVVDENYIRIKTDKGDLILKIKDENTLIGEGWAEGIYKKIK